ncbi:glycoside hydrolase family 125 protein [Babjeviella inositovora NRRL Y-12698]|uniref:Glycoside hydrolase family 125 protein n=1 Tax=Babjeviella inositovora NRRL Y-12698 TaxID=984486 RepID=A0A1E3QW04_9ASCO|nr:glycoside hydrolase family 125 protein [Babjeviella inositovora NRRL Y-12698]ODQ81838.1 glycoside hydrolase family 125 protein [Babjeviella inositovora NRRL Y-12698]
MNKVAPRVPPFKGKKTAPEHKPKPNSFFSNFKSCPDYVDYSQARHGPYSDGPLELPYMRPDERCRTFTSEAVEKVVADLVSRIPDLDLARLVENCLPNTLDTTVLWKTEAEAFIVTGDIHAEWLRDAARQLSVYQPLARYDPALLKLIRSAIATQTQFVLNSPYCNAFQPPVRSGLEPSKPSTDKVFPKVPWKVVFECKWELDSLASFLTLSNEYYASTGDASFVTEEWLRALETVLKVLTRQSVATYDENGAVNPFYYTFQRDTNIGSETLPLAGTGNPVNYGTGLVRSAFRPSDDACILQLFVPANAHMAVELTKTADMLREASKSEKVSKIVTACQKFAQTIRQGIYDHAVVNHPVFGEVFAYEVDGFGGTVHMDDANIPSLLSLPDLGFLDRSDTVYQNTRKMVLSKRGNPYYQTGSYFEAIGGPHVGIHSAWPMAALMRIRTSDNAEEIAENLEMLKKTTGGLGLMHETVNVNSKGGVAYSRPWFAWCNSEFGKTILDLAKRMPEVVFGEGAEAYDINEAFRDWTTQG